jgi:hypothetical protein
MFVLIAVGISSGLLAAAALAPVSFLAAVIIAPLISSATAILACFLIAWRNTAETGQSLQLDAQTDAMVVPHRASDRAAEAPSRWANIGDAPNRIGLRVSPDDRSGVSATIPPGHELCGTDQLTPSFLRAGQQVDRAHAALLIDLRARALHADIHPGGQQQAVDVPLRFAGEDRLEPFELAHLPEDGHEGQQTERTDQDLAVVEPVPALGRYGDAGAHDLSGRAIGSGPLRLAPHLQPAERSPAS